MKGITAIVAIAFLAGAFGGYLFAERGGNVVAQELESRTHENLDNAFGGESRAHMNYILYSTTAIIDGFPNVSRLLQAVSYAESVHARNHANILGMIGNTSENLQNAMDGENYENEIMYPEYYEIAVQEGNKEAQRSFHYALETEGLHATLFEEAKKRVDSGSDMGLDTIYVCPVCGYTHVSAPPELCPICRTPSNHFTPF